MKLLIATRNADKLKEIQALFSLPSLELLSLCDDPGLPTVVEDGRTFEDNAIKKAMTLALASRLWTLADDSGLDVPALGGAPGVFSARYAGADADGRANNLKLLREMKDITDRRAAFRCAIAMSSPTGMAQVVEGRCDGRIVSEPKGENGFGYDPLFAPNGYTATFAEMSAALKNSISHRGRALRKARELWGPALQLQLHDWPPRM